MNFREGLFGQCIDMEGNTLLIGSPSGGEGGEKSGVIYHSQRMGGLVRLYIYHNDPLQILHCFY